MIDGPDIDGVHTRTRGALQQIWQLGLAAMRRGAMRPMTKIIELVLATVVDRLWVPRPNIVPLQPLVGLGQRKSTAIRLDVHLVGWNASFPGYRSA